MLFEWRRSGRRTLCRICSRPPHPQSSLSSFQTCDSLGHLTHDAPIPRMRIVYQLGCGTCFFRSTLRVECTQTALQWE